MRTHVLHTLLTRGWPRLLPTRRALVVLNLRLCIPPSAHPQALRQRAGQLQAAEEEAERQRQVAAGQELAQRLRATGRAEVERRMAAGLHLLAGAQQALVIAQRAQHAQLASIDRACLRLAAGTTDRLSDEEGRQLLELLPRLTLQQQQELVTQPVHQQRQTIRQVCASGAARWRT